MVRQYDIYIVGEIIFRDLCGLLQSIYQFRLDTVTGSRVGIFQFSFMLELPDLEKVASMQALLADNFLRKLWTFMDKQQFFGRFFQLFATFLQY